MKQIKERWVCNKGCGEFTTKADLVKCPKCKTRNVSHCFDYKDLSQSKQTITKRRETTRRTIRRK